MSGTWLLVLTAVAALGCGLVGGVFFAFSAFVLQGLARLPARAGASAMRSINITAVRPAFMAALFGTAAGCAAVAVGAFTDASGDDAALLLAGSGSYLLGTIGVTVAANVPLNDELAGADPDGDETGGSWSSYVRRWSRWNHVRTVTALGACAFFLVALVD